MKARVKWLDGVIFVGNAEAGPGVVMAGASDAGGPGGQGLFPRPMELLLIGMLAKTAEMSHDFEIIETS